MSQTPASLQEFIIALTVSLGGIRSLAAVACESARSSPTLRPASTRIDCHHTQGTPPTDERCTRPTTGVSTRQPGLEQAALLDSRSRLTPLDRHNRLPSRDSSIRADHLRRCRRPRRPDPPPVGRADALTADFVSHPGPQPVHTRPSMPCRRRLADVQADYDDSTRPPRRRADGSTLARRVHWR